MKLGPDTDVLTLYVPKALKEQLRQEAKRLDKKSRGKVTVNTLGREALEDLLKKLEKEK